MKRPMMNSSCLKQVLERNEQRSKDCPGKISLSHATQLNTEFHGSVRIKDYFLTSAHITPLYMFPN
jgi:hypothetical protein